MKSISMDRKGVGEGDEKMINCTFSFRREGITLIMGSLSAAGSTKTDFSRGGGTASAGGHLWSFSPDWARYVYSGHESE